MSVGYSKINNAGMAIIPEKMLKVLGWSKGTKVAVSSGKSIVLKESTGKEKCIRTIDDFGRVVLPLELRQKFDFKEDDVVILEYKKDSISIVALASGVDRKELLDQKIQEEFSKSLDNRLVEDFAEYLKTASFSNTDIDNMLVKPNLLQAIFEYCVDGESYGTFIELTVRQFLKSKDIDVIRVDEVHKDIDLFQREEAKVNAE